MKYAALLILLAIPSLASGKRGFSPEDYYSIQIPEDPQISPDGKLVAYTLSSADRRQNRRLTDIWIVPTDGSREASRLTTNGSSSSPRWSPDARTLAYIAVRQDPQTGAQTRPQVFTLSMAGGEAQRLTNLKNGVTAFAWSPDGTRLVCVVKTGASDNRTPDREYSDVRNYLHSSYKLDGEGFFDDRRSHLWIVDVTGGGSPKQITFGSERNDSEPAWSPDGKRIVYLSSRTDGSPGNDMELYSIAVAGGAPLAVSRMHVDLRSPRWSPDGTGIAYIASEDETAIPKIWISAADGRNLKLASEMMTFAIRVEWAENGTGLYLAASVRGEQPVFHLDMASGALSPLTERVDSHIFTVHQPSATLAYVAADEGHPGDLFAINLHTRVKRQLTHRNAALLEQLTLPELQPFSYKGADGWDIQGFLAKPIDWKEETHFPMVLMVHGGPNNMWGFQWNHQLAALTGHGWAVLMTNPRGSSGYGESFQRGIDKEWGGKAYEDIMLGVDAALARFPWIDRNRLGVVGASYGGFMTNWIVGHTDRFKAAETLAGISDFISVEGIRDGFYGHRRDFGGDLFENFDLYWQYSPVRYASRVKTPTLVVHGESDQRVPLSQGEEFFRALRHFNVPTEFVIFPREGHVIRTEPRHIVELMKWEIYWFDRYLLGRTHGVRPNEESSELCTPGR